MEKEKQKPVMVRVPIEMFKELEKLAKDNFRSLNAQVLLLIQEGLKKSEKGKK